MSMSDRPISAACLRVFLYALAVGVVVWVIHQDADYVVAGEKFGERSFTESLQLILLAITIAGFGWAGWRRPDLRGFTNLMAGLALLAWIRELDWLLDHVVHGFWKYPAVLVLAGTGLLVWRRRGDLSASIVDFLQRPAWGVILSGFVTVFVFSRLFGYKGFWQAVLEDGYLRAAKNAAEEGTELLGYALLAIGAIEYARAVVTGNPSRRQATPVRGRPG